jgi:transcription antitermination factor NusG
MAVRRVYKKGDKIKIIGGPFAGVSALHSGMRASDREICLLAMLGSAERHVAIPSHQIEAA